MRSTARHRAVVILVGVLSLLGAAGTAVTAPGPITGAELAASRLAALEGNGREPNGVRFGAQLDWAADSPAAFSARSGIHPVVYGEFVEFPFRREVARWLQDKITLVHQADGVFMLTLQPSSGLAAVTPAALTGLSQLLTSWNAQGVPVIVRFGQEMNGGWYPWGQRPAAFIKTFRAVADAVHQAQSSRMLWSPNEGGGYPFIGNKLEPRKGSKDFIALDTDHDGALTQRDDPYRPYYPGDGYVDWVGLSLYHFGVKFPWKANVRPEKGKFVAKLTGHFDGGNGDERPVPDFYATYSQAKNKPMVISETGALYNTGVHTGATEFQIKSAWIDQVFAADLPSRFPNLRLIDWFEQKKREQPVSTSDVDWRLTYDPAVLAYFKTHTPPWLVFGPQVPATSAR